MTKTKPLPLWRTILDTLKSEIAAGHYGPGDRLPTELALAQRFGVNRHTVRRSLAEMAASDLIFTRRGAGAFVAHNPTEFALGQRVRFHQNLRAGGHTPQKRLLLLETRPADAREAKALALDDQAKVHVYEGISYSDGAPIALSRSVFPAEWLPDLPEALRASLSVTAALSACGISDYVRIDTRLTAKLATATQALHLQIAPNAPILRSVAINATLNDARVEYGRTWFAGDRVTLTLAGDNAPLEKSS